MMGNYWGYGTMMGNVGLFGIITWIALLVFLVLGSMYFWQNMKRRK
ncbi:hypothetical protein HYV22_03530 [Candidatus Gottesmanbacteria bacterium]|nr:hypothetical protein [Candidatus Gottesmanbacteria bacterium]